MNRYIVLGLVLAVMLLSACGKPNNKPQGIVVLSPEVAEIICALGAEEDIIGITAECNYPASLSSKKVVGNFSAIDREAIISLKPQLVFCSALEQEGMAAELGKLGISVEVIYPKSIKALSEEIKRIGSLIGKEQQATKLNAAMAASIAEIKANVGKLPRPKLYLEIYRDPLMSVSDASFVGELIETAGADNIFSTLERDYARVNPETVINAAPDMMLCYSQDTLESIISRKGWQNIPAIKDKQILFEKDINPDLLQRATPRCIEGMRLLQSYIAKWQATK